MAKMNDTICEQWEALRAVDALAKQNDFFQQKGVIPSTGKSYLSKWRAKRRVR